MAVTACNQTGNHVTLPASLPPDSSLPISGTDAAAETLDPENGSLFSDKFDHQSEKTEGVLFFFPVKLTEKREPPIL